MFAALSDEVAHLARNAAVGACWTQWVGLGSPASPTGGKRPQAIIDPEALVLLSLYVAPEERRLDDMVTWWARAGSRLTSLQRLRRLGERFPAQIGAEGLGIFAALALEAGDRRWMKDASPVVPEWVRRGKGSQRLQLIESSALWPRLRAAFGVGAKADILVFLIGMEGAWASAKMISFATGYSGVAVRKAVSEMALARLIRETEARPTEYLAPPGPWGELLELHSPETAWTPEHRAPHWRFCSELFAFLAGAMEWAKASDRADASERVHASRARDLVDRHQLAFDLNGIQVPAPQKFPGTSAAQGLLETVRSVAAWIEKAI